MYYAYHNIITIALNRFTIVLRLSQYYHNGPWFVDNYITIVIALLFQFYHNVPIFNDNIVIKRCGIIHMVFRAYALNCMTTLAASSGHIHIPAHAYNLECVGDRRISMVKREGDIGHGECRRRDFLVASLSTRQLERM